MNANAAVQNDELLAVCRDLTTEPVWKYEELPPLLLAEMTGLDLFEVGDTELARALWFWSRRPRLTFHDSVALPVMALCAVLSVAIALVGWSGTSIPDRTEIITLLLDLALGIYLIVQRIRFVRWRREYELSVDRLFRTIDPGGEGGSAIES